MFGVILREPRSARATSASTVSVLPARAGLSRPRRSAVGSGDGDAEHLAPGVLLGACGGVDHDALAGAGWADEDGQALRARQSPERRPLLTRQREPDPRGHLFLGELSRHLPHVATSGLRQGGRVPLDPLLLRSHRERGHPPALQRQDPPVDEHLARDLERLLGRELARALLQRHGPQPTGVEHSLALGQLRLDPVADRALGRLRAWSADQPHGLVRAEGVLGCGSAPRHAGDHRGSPAAWPGDSLAPALAARLARAPGRALR